MEVHAHTHTARKKWTHYFWEFFMLFLAVTLGFFVENWREHYVEHLRAKTYAANLVIDLQKDTASLSGIIRGNKTISNNLDSFNIILSSNTQRDRNGMLYYYAVFAGKINFFVPNNSTLEQLKNSGNLRYFSSDLAAKISSYENSLKDLDRDYMLQKSEFDKISDLRFKLFNGTTAKQLFIAAINGSRDSVFESNPPLINDDLKLMQEFSGWVGWVAAVYQGQSTGRLIPMKDQATELISMLKQEYR